MPCLLKCILIYDMHDLEGTQKMVLCCSNRIPLYVILVFFGFLDCCAYLNKFMI